MGNTDSKPIGESKQLLAEEVFHHIGALLVDGDLHEGERIRDVDVAEELHVSRTPVREALQRLERLGLVTMYPSRFTEVTAVTAEIESQSLEFAGYQAGAAARMAVPRLTEAQRRQAAALVQEMQAGLHDGQHTASTRWAVFEYLSDHSGNMQHRMLLADAGVALARNLRNWVVPAGDRGRMQQIYGDFGVAVLRGDADGAERLARAMYYV